MKKLLTAAAVLGLAAPAVAQVAAPAPAQQVQRQQVQRPAARVHTRAEVEAHVAQMFARLDIDRDGFLTKVEASAGRTAAGAHVRERVKQRLGDRGAQRGGDVFARLDANKDGAITRAEWDAGRDQRKERIAEVSRRVEGAHGMAGAHRMGMLGGRMFDTADANRDGRVSLQEAQAGALRHFDTLDANRDGQITREERIQIRKRVRTEPTSG